MARILQETISRSCGARSELRDVCTKGADITPDHPKETLTDRLRQMADPITDDPIRFLCEELNSTMTIFPGRNQRLIYEMGLS
ncbi:MAG: hypothetical protein MUF54_09765 [Polyangiaceae bacterium]|jgi:hypothetical protein|nr:hypothetical protein [Polyangiaceae bacterium]